MSRKGISPLVAAVLLIAFTMAVAGMFSQWSTGLFVDMTESGQDQQSHLLDCAGNTVTIIDIDENYEQNSIDVILQARGGDLGNVTVTAYPSTVTEEVLLDEDGKIESLTLEVESEQDSIVAASQGCDTSSEEDL